MNTFFATIMVIAIVILLILLIAASISLLIVFHFKDDRKNKTDHFIEEPIITVNPISADDGGRPIRDRRSLESFCWIPTEFRTPVPTTDSNIEKNINFQHTYFNPMFASTLQDKKRVDIVHMV